MKHELDRGGRTLRVIFGSDVLSTNADALKGSLSAILDGSSPPASAWDLLEADLLAAKMVDSVGLNLLVSLVKTLQTPGKKLRIRTGSSHVRRSLKFTRLDQLAELVGA